MHVNDRIHLKADALQVVVIKDAATGADAECGMEEWGGDDHQRWEAEHKSVYLLEWVFNWFAFELIP